MTLRRATALDAGACAAIVADWLATLDWMVERPSLQTLQSALQDGLPKREAWVVEDAGQVRGYVSLEPETAHVHALYTATPGRGFGRRLIDRVKEGRDYLQLRTHAPNAAAHRFYRREGFVFAARDLPGADGVPEHHMEWTR